MERINLKCKLFIVLSIVFVLFGFISSSVFAFSSSEVSKLDEELLNKVKSLEEYSTYNYYIVYRYGWDYGDSINHWSVFFFNDVSNLKFYTCYINGWPSIRSNKSFEYVEYHLDVNSYEVQNKTTLNQFYAAHILYSNNTCWIDGNYSVYTDDTYTDFFFRPGVVLLEPVEVSQIPEKIHQVLIILIRVGLIMFGVVLSPYLLKYRNSQIQ